MLVLSSGPVEMHDRQTDLSGMQSVTESGAAGDVDDAVDKAARWVCSFEQPQMQS